MTLGKRIETKRDSAGLSRTALAAVVGVTERTVYLWEADTVAPRFEFLRPIADALGCELTYLIDGSQTE